MTTHHIDGTGNNDNANILTVDSRENRRGMVKVELYESNAGHLFLIHGGKVWVGVEQASSTFTEDAKGILSGSIGGWTVPILESRHTNVVETCALVASYQEDGIMSLVMHAKPGRAASQYILGERDAEWVPLEESMYVYPKDGDGSVYPYEEMA